MKSEASEYLTDIWNIFDLIGFVGFYCLFYFQISTPNWTDAEYKEKQKDANFSLSYS